MGNELSEMTLEELWKLFPVILKGHNSEYRHWYETEREDIIRHIGYAGIKRINHIGSTAVPGLLAKPTVDILLEIDRGYNMEQLKNILINNKWILMFYQDEPEIQMGFNKGYTPDGFAEKVYHLHVRYSGDWGELYFRDYLIEYSEVAAEYAKLKESLQEKFEHNRDAYSEAKSEFVLACTKKARGCYGNRYLP